MKVRFIALLMVIISQFILISCGGGGKPVNGILEITLLTPINNEEIVQEGVILDWSFNLSNEYTSKVFLGLSENTLNEVAITNNTFHLFEQLNSGTKYYWKIVAEVNQDRSEYKESKIESFTTEGPVMPPKRYEDILQELNDVENGLERTSITTLEQSLTNIQIDILNQNIPNSETNELLSLYNYNMGWIQIRKEDRQLDYFIQQIDFDDIGILNNYVGLVYSLTNELRFNLDFNSYYDYLDELYKYLGQGFKNKIFNGVNYDFRNFSNYLQVLYSIVGNDHKLNKIDFFINDSEVYNNIYNFTYGEYPE